MLLCVQATLANLLVNRNRLSQNATAFPGIWVILLNCFTPDFLFLSSFHVVNVLVLLSLLELSSTYNIAHCADKLFNLGLLAGVACLFFPGAIYLIPLIFIGLNSLRSYKVRERIIPLCGFVVPLAGMWLYHFWYDSTDQFLRIQGKVPFGWPVFSIGNPGKIFPLVVGTFLLLTILIRLDLLGQRRGIEARKGIGVLAWTLVFSLGAALFLPAHGTEAWLLVAMPLGLLLSLVVLGMSKNGAETAFVIMVIIGVAGHYLRLFL